MKKYLLTILGAAVMGAIAAIATTTFLVEPNNNIDQAIWLNPFDSGATSHFTSYKKQEYPDLTYAAENAVKAVVNIESIQEVQSPSRDNRMEQLFEFFGMPQNYGRGNGNGGQTPRQTRSGGSGVIISSDGYIITNNHVIENATTLKVRLNEGKTYQAKLIGADPTTDIALIKIEAEEKLPALVFGNSDELRLGEWVLAIGSPFDLQNTVTAGIVSAKARNLDVIPDQFRIESFIQTDAAVNPGNSGGALVNTAGELVGINTVIKSPTGSYTGYSFAVPEAIVKKVVLDLKEYGLVQRALLGVVFQEINAAFIEQYGKEYGISEIGGVYVHELSEGGAAKDAGIKKGDIITQVDNTKITSSSQLQEQIARHRPSEKVKIYVKRDGEVKHFDVVLRNKAGKEELLSKDYVDVVNTLGAKLSDITDKTCKELRISGGARVESIEENGILSKARVRKGYIITHINDREILKVADIAKISEKVRSIDGVYPDGRSASYSLYYEKE